MKGIICEEIGKFVFQEDLPEPQLEKDHAIVEIRRIGICGTDYHAYQGRQPFFQYPRVLGHELAGIIMQIDSVDENLRIGDQVSIIPYLHCGECEACLIGKTNCCKVMKVIGVHVDGGMRERISIPVKQLIPTNQLSLEQAAMLEPLAIGAHAIRRSGLSENQTVLVIGAGPIGLGIMNLAKYVGAKVLAMDVNDERLAFCQSWAKVDHIIHALDNPQQKITEVNNGHHPVIVFDATGNTKSMTSAFNYVAHGGTLVYVGLVKDDISFNDSYFHSKEITLMGSRNATTEDFGFVLDALHSGAIDIDQYVTHRYSFEEVIDSFEQLLKPESKVIKAVIEL